MVTMSKEYQRNYYQQNKGKFTTKYNGTEFCEQCQCVFKRKYRARHLQTKKHLHNLEQRHEMPPAEVAAEVDEKRSKVKLLLSQIKVLESEVA